MTFTYVEGSSGTYNDIWSGITNYLNGQSSLAAQSAKVATSDQHNGDARYVVIVSTATEAPDEKTLGTTWNSVVFNYADYGNSYTGMYNACIDYLNNSDELSETQKYYSRLSMTNGYTCSSYLVLYYRNQP
jgi:hypothetical protein